MGVAHEYDGITSRNARVDGWLMDHLQSVVFSYHWRFGAGYDLSLDAVVGHSNFSRACQAVCQLFPLSAVATGIALVLFCCTNGV